MKLKLRLLTSAETSKTEGRFESVLNRIKSRSERHPTHPDRLNPISLTEKILNFKKHEFLILEKQSAE